MGKKTFILSDYVYEPVKSLYPIVETLSAASFCETFTKTINNDQLEKNGFINYWFY